MRIAVQVVDEKEARAVLDDTLAALRQELPLRAPAIIRPLHRRTDDDIWIAVLEPDLTRILAIEPDNAPTRCSLIMNYFPLNMGWLASQNTEREAKREWPPSIWGKEAEDDVLLHPAVRAVMFFCTEK